MLTANDVITALGGRPASVNWDIAGVTQDSRLVQPGSVFVALRGENQDGHAFVADALARGAGLLIVQEPDALPAGLSVMDLRPGAPSFDSEIAAPLALLVPDALVALQLAASSWRQRRQVDVIGVTGSVGKTTTKEMIAAVLATKFRVLKSERNLNNEIGLPLTVLQLDVSHEKAVLEMGMYAAGEINLLCDIAKPSIGVVTNIGPTHLQRLGSIERIADAKRELVDCLPADGWAVLNGDDLRVRAMADGAKCQVFLYGLAEGLDLWADEIESHGLEGIVLRLHHGGDSVYLKVPLLGQHSAHTVLAAAAVGLLSGLTWEEIAAGLSVVPDQLRLVVVAGLNGSTVIDDTYNSSPASALAGLNLLAELEGRHVAVLGDMLELGPYEGEGHKLVGRRAAAVVGLLVAVGPRGRLIAEEALHSGMAPETVILAVDNAAAVAALKQALGPGDFVLVKGSRGMRMEEIVEGIRS